MTVLHTVPSPHNSLGLMDLTDSWVRSLRAENRSERTIESYLLALRQLADHIGNIPVSEVTPDDIRSFISLVLKHRASATARQRYASLKQFFKWAYEEEEISTDPMAKIRPPRVVEQPVEVLADDDIRALLKAAKGNGFNEVRDSAIIMVLIDTGVRLGELVGMKLTDIIWDDETITVTGKGGRTRKVQFGRATSKALDRYDRRRRLHPDTDRPELWLGRRGPLKGNGIHQALNRRPETAGIGHIHAHQFRHSFANSWLQAGGNEGDLQELAGWKSPQMLRRYGASAAAARARDAHRRWSRPAWWCSRVIRLLVSGGCGE